MAAADAWQFSRLAELMAAAGALGISIEQVVVAALYAYSPQVHWASGVLDHVDVTVPKPGSPGAFARLAGTGA